MDESLMRFDRVLINGGQRGTMLKMAPEDIVILGGGFRVFCVIGFMDIICYIAKLSFRIH